MFSCQCDLVIKLDVSRRCTDLYLKCTRCDIPLTHTVVGIISELFRMEFHCDSLGLARLKRNAREALKLYRTDVLSFCCRRKIKLSDLVSSYISGILQLECKIHILV